MPDHVVTALQKSISRFIYLFSASFPEYTRSWIATALQYVLSLHCMAQIMTDEEGKITDCQYIIFYGENISGNSLTFFFYGPIITKTLWMESLLFPINTYGENRHLSGSSVAVLKGMLVVTEKNTSICVTHVIC